VKGIAYIRVSTVKQDEELQLNSILEFAKAKGIEIIKTYADRGESGAKPFKSRSQAQLLLQEIDTLKPDVVVAWSLDRLGRSMLDTLNTVLELEARGYRVITVKEEWLQTLDSNIRRLILSILAWVAEFERERMKERREEAWRQGKQKGRPPKVSDDVIIQYYLKYRKYGTKKYVWLRMREDGYDISYDRFRKRLRKLVKVKEVVEKPVENRVVVNE